MSRDALPGRFAYDQDHEAFRQTVRSFLVGGGYMNEYPIARMWRSARVSRIYGGTNEIMKEVIGRTL